MNMHTYRGKRTFDCCFSLFALIMLTPLLILAAVLIRLKLGSPTLFRQKRTGLYGKPFDLFKFRTMTDARDVFGKLLPDEARLTSFGHFLRSSSVDELPELFNVLKGEMSLIGPRPLLPQYLERYTSEQVRRHDVMPGITGWAQIHGRNTITWEKKFTLDVWYVDNISLCLDMKIVLLTIWKIFRREGINQTENSTMEEFFGTQGR